MDYQVLADLLFPHVTETPDELEARFPARSNPGGFSCIKKTTR